MFKSLLFTFFFATQHCFQCGECDADTDRISFLPGIVHQPQFAQYSGYLNGADPNIQLHYWFVEAREQPDKAPLVLWLNGGPGCSSLGGILEENGPFTVQEGNALENNPYSWNKFANVLYLESPAGVGFSYAVNKSGKSDDEITSLNNYHALKNFLDRFPVYKDREFFVIGESYAGVYVPTLANRILENPLRLKFKGIAVGNGLFSYQTNDNSLLYFLNYHGLLDEEMWSKLLDTCCTGQDETKCLFTKNKFCESLVNQSLAASLGGINMYNIYAQCDGGASDGFLHVLGGQTELRSDEGFRHSDFGNMFRTNTLIKKQREKLNILRRLEAVNLSPPCMDCSKIESYLNQDSVRKALNVNAAGTGVWELCSANVNQNYQRLYKDLSPQYLRVLSSKVRVLLYSGDVDAACNYLGTLWFVDNLGLAPKVPFQPWFYVDQNGYEQIGGFYKEMQYYGTDLRYVTIRGSGHLAPRDKPIATFDVVRSFVRANNHSAGGKKQSSGLLILFLAFVYVPFQFTAF
ncbi:unnamed protein product [Calicophoron daubneyi]|uniref:Carboxypeptidase n=1 Tax=Calicophoron daubneyi TaxID=300641 RepID=A0AAV2TDB0_CALDB